MDRGIQEPLPSRRQSSTYKFHVGSSPSTYMRTGDYEDGRLGEIFLTQSRLGSFSRGMLDAFALVCSKALQFGMPLEELCDSFIEYRFEPSGFVEGDEEITDAASLLDYIFQRLKKDYLDGESDDGSQSSFVPTPPTEPGPVSTVASLGVPQPSTGDRSDSDAQQSVASPGFGGNYSFTNEAS